MRGQDTASGRDPLGQSPQHKLDGAVALGAELAPHLHSGPMGTQILLTVANPQKDGGLAEDTT